MTARRQRAGKTIQSGREKQAITATCPVRSLHAWHPMSKILRGLAAGYGAKKLGGGCGCGTILIFIILWYVLGHFGIFK